MNPATPGVPPPASLPSAPDESKDISEIFLALAAQARTPLDPLIAEPPYVGIATFFRLPHQPDPQGLDIALVGVPYDSGLTGRTGARGGPRAVRDASCLTGAYEHQTKNIPALICNCADIPHDPDEGRRLPANDPSIPYQWSEGGA